MVDRVRHRLRPTRVHTGACKAASRGRAVTRKMILEVLRTMPSVIACPLCLPDSELRLLDSCPTEPVDEA
ncbi:DUF6233 domain-containing protein [Streptomyces sp. H27-H5]|uniref:DUF6233 domain-containing protein n=1 Tax=Streptomyces sp. H27-H5 TaxID=2996460 RepID=UPI003B6338DD